MHHGANERGLGYAFSEVGRWVDHMCDDDDYPITQCDWQLHCLSLLFFYLTFSMYTQEDWNEKSSVKCNPYSYAKTLAEKLAWEYANVSK